MVLNQIRKKKKDKIKKRFMFRTIILVLLLATIIYAFVIHVFRDTDTYKVGDQAPNFELTQVNKNNKLESVQLNNLEGKGILLNFWTTYCKPCEVQMVFMENLYSKYKDDVEMIAVNLDNSELVIQQFIEKYNLTYPILHDTRSEIMGLYDIGPIPSTLLISPEGEIIDKVEGGLTLEKLDEHLKKIQSK